MTSFFRTHSYLLALLLLLIGGVILSNARGNFPLNDDWTYAWSVQKLQTEHVLTLGDWPAMTLVTHLIWGLMFTKLFGFSFAVLRLSTLFSAVIGLAVLFQLTRRISGNKKIAFGLCLSLLGNPLYFNLVNTYMTDVNFCTLLTVSIYLAWLFFEEPRWQLLPALLLVSIGLVLLRQYGIIFPLVFTFSCLLLSKKRLIYVFAGLLICMITYLIYLRYEVYLRLVLSPEAAYKYSDVLSPADRKFWLNLFTGISSRYRIILIHALFYTASFTLAFLPSLIKARALRVQGLVALAAISLAFFLFIGYPLQIGNVLSNTGIGPDTSYTTLNGYYTGHPHFFSQQFEDVLNALKIIFLSAAFFVVFQLVLSLPQRLKHPVNRSFLFLVFLFGAYVVMLLETDTFFDRYQMPVIVLSLLILAYTLKSQVFSFWVVILPLLFWFYISIAGTRDYFSWNRLKWQAYEELRQNDGVQADSIHAGFEIMCWEGGAERFRKEFDNLAKSSYVIQFDELDSFIVVRKYAFRRYLLPGSDTLRVLKRSKYTKNSAP